MIPVVADTNVAFQWFHADHEREAEPSNALIQLYGERAIALSVLDLTRYELGNALLLGHVGASAARVATILDALAVTCPSITPIASDVRDAVQLAVEHRLTMYDATYAAVARSRGAQLATLDKALLKAGLGRRPSEIVELVKSA
jgi:predicted nucleic acid-binding protein